MVSSIDPTVDSINALSRWKPEAEYLVVKEGKTQTGSKVKYIGIRGKPGFWGRLAEKIRVLFGGGSWRLDRVAETLNVVIGDATKLSPAQIDAVTTLLQKIYDFNSHHKGRISAALITKFQKLVYSGPPAIEEKEKAQKQETAPPQSAAQVLTDIRKGRARPPPRRPPTRKQALAVPETSPTASSSSSAPEPSSKKPVGATGLGHLPGLEEALRRRQERLGKPPEQKT